MATTKTLLQLRTESLQRADLENSNFISESELNAYINASGAELYDILVTTYSDYYLSSTTSTITSGNTISLPADFYKLRGVDFQLSTSEWITISKYNFERRNDKNRDVVRTIRGEPTRQYRLQGSTINIEPEDRANGTYRIWYVPVFTELTADGDLLDSVNFWHEYIVIDAAIKMGLKEETDVQALMMQKAAIHKRIQDAAAERDVGEPERIADTSNQLYFDDFPWNS